MVFEIEINNVVYEFKFGIGWMREINKRVEAPISPDSAIKQKVGLKLTIASVLDGEIDALVDVLYTANAGFKPRISKAELEEYIESEETDIEALFDKVVDFFERANVTKRLTAEMLEGLKKVQEQNLN